MTDSAGLPWGGARARRVVLVLLALLVSACPERAPRGSAHAAAEERATTERPTTQRSTTERVTEEMVERAAPASSPPASPATPHEPRPGAVEQPEGLSEESPFASREACLRAVAALPAQHRRGEDTARIGTWNIRWYPDGRPGRKPADPGTDIAWLACAIAVLDVDVLAVQEMKILPRAMERTAELLAELGRLTGGTWRAGFDDCPQQPTQHVGLLWNEARVEVSELRTEPSLNPHGAPCKDALRPGYAAEVRLGNGQRVHVVSVHFKSGAERRSLDLRAKSFDSMPGVLASARALAPAADVIFAGDFNTMGCTRCSPKVSAADELEGARKRAERAGLRWLATTPSCSGYYRDRPQLLDGFVVTPGAASRTRAVMAAGLCGELDCKPTRKVGMAPAMRRLSDHCPVVMELSSDPVTPAVPQLP